MMSIKRFQILFVVCMIKLIAGNEVDSVAKHIGSSTNDNHQGTNEELKVLKDELQKILEGQNKIEQELEILGSNKLELNVLDDDNSTSSPDTLGADVVLRYVQSSQSKIGVYYQGEPINNNDTEPLPRDCQEAYDKKYREDGVYQIQLDEFPKMMVVCDMTSYGGGWTVVQKRFDGSQDFFREWREYKFGFGDLGREFCLGLEYIHALTKPEGQLLVELVTVGGTKATGNYQTFGIGPETGGYELTNLDGYTGNIGDSLSYHKGHKFSTKDSDLDSSLENCAEKYYGAWWYNGCLRSNPNGKFINLVSPPYHKEAGLYWKTFGDGVMAASRLMVKTKTYRSN
ncbi:microfibril-associated glycoprotein 4-like [Leptinotarsa decemlineata]|uniref:microfibril-associated glycoprotein 4-like n=1 Tax=Leptinotarsa decemlineata TaxID=7539 RepID=UPI003D30C01F